MPNVTRGDRMGGLLVYLAGPGRSNEHTEPHLVGGDAALMAWHSEDELNRDSALAIAQHLDRPRKAFDVEVPQGHVWHCSLSIRADEGQLTDERWGAIADDFVREMGFDDNEGTKAPCRWVAVRHGLSAGGNDHVHLAVQLVREDGTKASVHNDHQRAQRAARALEVRHGLEQLESVKTERATRGFDPAEREAQGRARARAKYERDRTRGGSRGPAWASLPAGERSALVSAQARADEPRLALARTVRGCATSSADEAEFVRRVRRAGALLRPRFAQGRTDVVTGYSVAARPEHGERPIWYGGGQLGRDLTLPRLRSEWPDSPTSASDAAAEWTAAGRGRRVVAPGRESTAPDPELWGRQNQELSALVECLRSVPVDDRDTWATVARQTAGALAAWSNATEEVPGDLAAASEALSRSAQTYRRTVAPQKAGTVAISGAAMLLASAARGGQGTAAQAVMIRQFLRLAQAVHAASVAAQQTRQAQLLAEDTRGRLMRIRDALPRPQGQAGAATATIETAPPLALEVEAVAARQRASQGHDATRATSPLPNKIEPSRARQSTKPGADRGPER
ncbi:relaxase/mobilization nuclease domain-containing protein [Occultella glacieicola]|nr:relaxase/mobilization nuclease domain-containing protein [Occultella glacieicola]